MGMAPIAELPACRAMVCVDPPLFCSPLGSSLGSVFCWSLRTGSLNPQSVPSSKLFPRLLTLNKLFFPLTLAVLLATMVALTSKEPKVVDQPPPMVAVLLAKVLEMTVPWPPKLL